jgi:hypothetical protein
MEWQQNHNQKQSDWTSHQIDGAIPHFEFESSPADWHLALIQGAHIGPQTIPILPS